MIYSIIPNKLYIGDTHSYQAVDFIRNTIHYIIDFKDTSELEVINMDCFFKRSNIVYIKSDTPDNEIFNIICEFEYIIKLIGDVTNQSILMTCNCAISRSVTYSIMYLIKVKRYSLVDAFDILKKVNPYMTPNIGFVKNLILYEKLILDYNSITLKEYIKLRFTRKTPIL
jgi:protein-tyrosine phosphatase